MSDDIELRGVEAVYRSLSLRQRVLSRRADRIVADSAERLRLRLINHASGRPGPRVVTGEYISRFRVVRRRSGRFGVEYAVVNDHPATWRLEYGFVGVDSEGRVYDQPPFPHWRPAIAEERLAVRSELRRL